MGLVRHMAQGHYVIPRDEQGFVHRNRICFSSLGLKEVDCKRRGESNKPRGHSCLLSEFLSL